jgi:hypothetical protein
VLSKRRKDRGSVPLDQIDRALLTASLFGKSPSQQIALWHQFGAPRSVPTSFENLLRAPSTGQMKKLAIRLAPDQPVDKLGGWLVYLVLSAPEQLPRRWETLAALLAHKDTSIRQFVFEIAVNAKDAFFAKRHLESAWAASTERSQLENRTGSFLLAMLATSKTFKAISERIDPQWSAIPWRKMSYRPDFAYAFESFLKIAVERELNPPASWSFPHYGVSPREATRKLIEQKTVELTTLADRLFSDQIPPLAGRYEFPRIEMMKAFLEIDPAKGAQYWTKLSEFDGIFKAGDDIEQVPFEVGDGEEVNQLRKMLIMRASTDWKLLTLSSSIVRHKRTNWAVSLIKNLLAKPESSGDIARSITIAGFLDDSKAVRGLWKKELAEAPLGGWIGVVYRDARANVEKTWASLELLDQALAAKNDEQFFAYWELFVVFATRSTLSAAARRITAKLKALPRRRREFIAFAWEDVRSDASKAKKDLEDKLFSFSTGHRWARPWADS